MNCSVLECPLQESPMQVAAKFFRGLGDPTRLAILNALCSGPLRVIDLCRETGRAQPNVSAHLACLRDCGLVSAQPSGRETYYAIADERLKQMLGLAFNLICANQGSIGKCPRYKD